ncbi:MAG: RluA family pseudouridine synthase [Campylobacterales bacterium]|nr:RluA family pseudouridine synthase [Campylobacterales bacterium]
MANSFTCNASWRLDLFLTTTLSASRNQVAHLIKTHGVLVNGTSVHKTGFKLQAGDVVEVREVEAPTPEVVAVDFEIPILYEDDHLMVLNKPPLLTVHPAPSVKEATVVDWLRARGFSLSTLSGEERHGIVHRLDKETSGALVIAKTNEAHRALAAQLENKSMGRYYVALIDLPLKAPCVVDKPIARNPKNRLKMGIVEGGREAKSAFCKLALGNNGATELIGAKLFSGRTHQIRVHLESLSRHILGDTLYGFKSQKATIPRVMLHAYALYLEHPVTKAPMQWCAPLYEDFETQLHQYFTQEERDEALLFTDFTHRFDGVDEWVSKGTSSARRTCD